MLQEHDFLRFVAFWDTLFLPLFSSKYTALLKDLYYWYFLSLFSSKYTLLMHMKPLLLIFLATFFVKMHTTIEEAFTTHQGPRSLRKCAGAKGGTIFSGDFLLHFSAIWKNDPFSKFENMPGLKPRRLRGPCYS